jgi:hypothetical protein
MIAPLSSSVLTHNHPDYWDDLLRQVRIQFPFVRTMKVTQTHITFTSSAFPVPGFRPGGATRTTGSLYRGRQVREDVMKRYTEDNKETEMTVTIFESEEIASQIRNGSAEQILSEQVFHFIRLPCPGFSAGRRDEDNGVIVQAPPGRKPGTGKADEVKDLFGQYLLLTHNHPDYWDAQSDIG